MSLYLFEDTKIISLIKENKTIIIFDWDDTLFPSTYLVKKGYIKNIYQVTSNFEELEKFKQLENKLYLMLEKSLSLGDVYIITNSDKGWVELSSNVFLPKIITLLSKIKIISAKSTYETFCQNNPFKWKFFTFDNLFSKIFLNNNINKNIISMGDSFVEDQAIKNVAYGRKNLHCKCIKFVDHPTFEELQYQVNYILNNIEWIYKLETNLDLKLVTNLKLESLNKDVDNSALLTKKQSLSIT
jgi:hypothetical protein